MFARVSAVLGAVVLASTPIFSQGGSSGGGGGDTADCYCPINSSFSVDNVTQPPPPCADTFGITLKNKVLGRCDVEGCGLVRQCRTDFTAWADDDPANGLCNWLLVAVVRGGSQMLWNGTGGFQVTGLFHLDCGEEPYVLQFFANGILLGEFLIHCHMCPAAN